MADWKDYKGQYPWGINPVTGKTTYNEGSKLATVNNPVWNFPAQGSLPITPGHNPCGYWHKF